MFARRWVLLATVSVGLLLIMLDNSILYTALPTLTRELGASPEQSLWIINAYPLVMAGLLLGSGTLGDRVGHQRMFLGGLVVFGLASLLAAFSPTADVLIAARAVLAVGAAAMMPATLALIRIGFTDVRERNFAIGVWGSVSVLGMALGPILSGVLLEFFWWGSAFLINVPVVVVALIVAPLVAPRSEPDRSRSWDWVSSLLATLTLVGLVLFIKEVTKTGADVTVVLVSALVAVVGALLFVRRQQRLAQPLLDFAIFRNRAFSAGVLAAGATMFAVAGMQLITTQRFQLVAEYTPLQAGLLVAALALGSLPTSLLAGAYLHLLGLRLLIAGGLLVAAAGGALAGLSIGTTTLPVLLGLVMIGAGIGAVMAVASTAIVGNVPPRRAGMASSVEEVSYEFGSLLAVALLGTLLTTLYSRLVELPAGTSPAAAQSLSDALDTAGGQPDLLQAAFAAFDNSYQIIALIIAALMLLGALVCTRMLRSYGLRSESSLPESVH